MYESFIHDAITSANNYYEYAKRNKTSRNIVNIRQVTKSSKDVYILFLAQILKRPEAISLCINSPLIEPTWYAGKGETYILSDLFEIIKYDPHALTVHIRVKDPLSHVFHQIAPRDITIVSDLKFLIWNVKNWYSEYGDWICCPPRSNN